MLLCVAMLYQYVVLLRRCSLPRRHTYSKPFVAELTLAFLALHKGEGQGISLHLVGEEGELQPQLVEEVGECLQVLLVLLYKGDLQ